MGSDDAPTTAKTGEEKNVLTAASAILVLCERRMGMNCEMGRKVGLRGADRLYVVGPFLPLR